MPFSIKVYPLLHRLRSNAPLTATRFVRQMRGSSKACLLECDDGEYYVVKFANNPQGPNLLANEMLGNCLCASIGLPVAEAAPIYLSPSFLRDNALCTMMSTDDVVIETPPGLHFGSKLLRPRSGFVQEHIRNFQRQTLLHRSPFLGMYVMDLCTLNLDRRQVLLTTGPSDKDVHVTFIDNGAMFGGPHWLLTDRASVLGAQMTPSAFIQNLNGCLAWAKRIHTTVPKTLEHMLPYVPHHWYTGSLSTLLTSITERAYGLSDMVVGRHSNQQLAQIDSNGLERVQTNSQNT